MSWSKEPKRHVPRAIPSSGVEQTEAIFSQVNPRRKTTPTSSQIVEGDVMPLPGPYQPDVFTNENDEIFRERHIVPYRSPDAVSEATPPSPPKHHPVVSVPGCPSCKGAGWFRQDVPFGHPNFGKLKKCACLIELQRKQHQRELLMLSNLSEEQRRVTLQTFFPHIRGVQQAYQSARRLALSLQNWGQERAALAADGRTRNARCALPGQWKVLIGGVGVGKTHLALAVGNMALDAQVEVLFSPVPDLLDHLRATFAPDATVIYDELFERMRNVELLILDDLGAQRKSAWEREKLFQLLNHRYNFRLLTVITMNEKAWTSLDDRLQSRLSDKRLVEIVGFRGAQDYRRQGRRAEAEDHWNVEGE